MSFAETCSCGAGIQYPAKLGVEPAVQWRETHRHETEKPPPEHEELRADIGFCLPTRELEEDE